MAITTALIVERAVKWWHGENLSYPVRKDIDAEKDPEIANSCPQLKANEIIKIPRVKKEAAPSKSIKLSGSIRGNNPAIAEITKTFKESGVGSTISVTINSGGGRVIMQDKIINAMKTSKAQSVTICEKKAFSSAADILLAADRVLVRSSCIIMIHPAYTPVGGIVRAYTQVNTPRESAMFKRLWETSSESKKRMVARGLTPACAHALSGDERKDHPGLEYDVWILPKYALKLGLVDAIVDEGEDHMIIAAPRVEVAYNTDVPHYTP